MDDSFEPNFVGTMKIKIENLLVHPPSILAAFEAHQSRKELRKRDTLTKGYQCSNEELRHIVNLLLLRQNDVC